MAVVLPAALFANQRKVKKQTPQDTSQGSSGALLATTAAPFIAQQFITVLRRGAILDDTCQGSSAALLATSAGAAPFSAPTFPPAPRKTSLPSDESQSSPIGLLAITDAPFEAPQFIAAPRKSVTLSDESQSSPIGLLATTAAPFIAQQFIAAARKGVFLDETSQSAFQALLNTPTDAPFAGSTFPSVTLKRRDAPDETSQSSLLLTDLFVQQTPTVAPDAPPLPRLKRTTLGDTSVSSSPVLFVVPPTVVDATPGVWTWTGASATSTQVADATPGAWTWAGVTATFTSVVNATPGTWSWAGTTATSSQVADAVAGTWSWAGVPAQVVGGEAQSTGPVPAGGRRRTRERYIARYKGVDHEFATYEALEEFVRDAQQAEKTKPRQYRKPIKISLTPDFKEEIQEVVAKPVEFAKLAPSAALEQVRSIERRLRVVEDDDDENDEVLLWLM